MHSCSVLIFSIDENYFRRQILLDSAYLCTYVPLSALSYSSLFQDLRILYDASLQCVCILQCVVCTYADSEPC